MLQLVTLPYSVALLRFKPGCRLLNQYYPVVNFVVLQHHPNSAYRLYLAFTFGCELTAVTRVKYAFLCIWTILLKAQKETFTKGHRVDNPQNHGYGMFIRLRGFCYITYWPMNTPCTNNWHTQCEINIDLFLLLYYIALLRFEGLLSIDRIWWLLNVTRFTAYHQCAPQKNKCRIYANKVHYFWGEIA